MYVGTYLSKIRGLMNLKRYQNLYLFKQRSVAEHSWSVAKIAQSLAYLEMQKFGNSVDMGLLLQKAITHDELELITGDILSHTKRRTPAMLQAVDELEQVIFEEEYAVKILPKNWAELFRKFTLEAKDESIEGKILGAADVIDTLLEATEEIKLGNLEYFTDVLRNSAEKLLKIDLDSVRHFLKHSLSDFGLDVRQYYGYNVYQAIQEMKTADGSEDIIYIPFEDVMEFIKSSNQTDWVVQHDEHRGEVMRFRNKSLYQIEVVKNGASEEIRKELFSIPFSDLMCGKWFVLSQAETNL
ncbi:YfbR-like 5'-deoxynucleotidase [Brevibacillus sp. NPDC058079]|uniref:YfbR-like 5'-deoxynucleotidase n=1 Tax=Brevibacillus sp. NPDC058079 TaxID=3346330 RepID=UPI0036E852A9